MLKKHFKGTNVNLEKQTLISKEWASQFWAKQYVKSKYMLNEKDLKKIVKTGKFIRNTEPCLINILNYKLEVIIYILGWAPSIKAARHLIKRGKIQIEKSSKENPLTKKFFIVKNPKVRIQLGETISLTGKNKTYSPLDSTHSFILKKENLDGIVWKTTATLIKPIIVNKLIQKKCISKFELYCNKFGRKL